MEPGMMFRSLDVLVSLGIAVATLTAGSSIAQTSETPCGSLRPVANVLGYRLRDQNIRCEGLYESTVRAVGLELVGVTTGGPFDLSHSPVEITGPRLAGLPPEAGKQIYVRAVALPLKTYYRMDGILDETSKLVWPVDEVVGPAGLEARDIALYGWVGTEMEQRFVPVRVTRQGADHTDSGDIQLVFRVSSAAESIYWRTTIGGVESEWEPAIEGPVRSGQSIAVDLPNEPPSEVRVDVTAKPKNSDEWTTLRFYVLREIAP